MKDHEKEKYIVENQGLGEKEEVLTSAKYPDTDMELFIQITRCVEENVILENSGMSLDAFSQDQLHTHHNLVK